MGKLKNFGGIFKLLGANVLVEFENVFLMGAVFTIGGKCVSGIQNFFF